MTNVATSQTSSLATRPLATLIAARRSSQTDYHSKSLSILAYSLSVTSRIPCLDTHIYKPKLTNYETDREELLAEPKIEKTKGAVGKYGHRWPRCPNLLIHELGRRRSATARCASNDNNRRSPKTNAWYLRATPPPPRPRGNTPPTAGRGEASPLPQDRFLFFPFFFPATFVSRLTTGGAASSQHYT